MKFPFSIWKLKNIFIQNTLLFNNFLVFTVQSFAQLTRSSFPNSNTYPILFYRNLGYNIKFTVLQNQWRSCTVVSVPFGTIVEKLTSFTEISSIGINLATENAGYFWFKKGYWFTSQHNYHSRHGGSIKWIFLSTQKFDMYTLYNFLCWTWFHQEVVHEL